MRKPEPQKSKAVTISKFSDAEIGMFKNTFCENTMLMQIIFNTLLQLTLSPTDKDILASTFKGKTELLALMRKKLIPNLDPNTHYQLNTDIWTEVKFDGILPELVILDIRAKDIVLKLLEEGVKRLENPEHEPSIKLADLSKFDDLSKTDDVYVNVKARNDFISHVRAQMWSIISISGMRDETVESIKTRLFNNSSK